MASTRFDSNKVVTLDDWRRGDPLTARHFQQPIEALKKLTRGVALPRQRAQALKPRAGAAGDAGADGATTWTDFCVVVQTDPWPGNAHALLTIRLVDAVFESSATNPNVPTVQFYVRAKTDNILDTRNGSPALLWTDYLPYVQEEIGFNGPRIKLTREQSRKMCVLVEAGRFVIEPPFSTVPGNEIIKFKWVQPLISPTL